MFTRNNVQEQHDECVQGGLQNRLDDLHDKP
jgi:hypothetical protein